MKDLPRDSPFARSAASSLQAFEMNPVTGESAPVEEPAPTDTGFHSRNSRRDAGQIRKCCRKCSGRGRRSSGCCDTVPVEETPVVERLTDQDVDLEYDDSKYDYLDVDESNRHRLMPLRLLFPRTTVDITSRLSKKRTLLSETACCLARPIFMIIFVGCGGRVFVVHQTA